MFRKTSIVKGQRSIVEYFGGLGDVLCNLSGNNIGLLMLNDINDKIICMIRTVP